MTADRTELREALAVASVVQCRGAGAGHLHSEGCLRGQNRAVAAGGCHGGDASIDLVLSRPLDGELDEALRILVAARDRLASEVPPLEEVLAEGERRRALARVDDDESPGC